VRVPSSVDAASRRAGARRSARRRLLRDELLGQRVVEVRDAHPATSPLPRLEERLEDVDRHREDGRRVVLRRDLDERLQEAELERDRLLAMIAALGERCAAWYSPSAAITLARRSRSASAWPRHRAPHLLGQVDVLHRHLHDLDAPRIGVLVDDRLQVRVDLLALGEELVELGLAAHARAAWSARSGTSRTGSSRPPTTARFGSITRK
jgi:hypothetical protein